MKIRVLLADDHSVVREGIRRVLEKAGDIDVVGEAADGQQALDLVASLKPDVLLCDIRLPALNGVEVVRQAKDRYQGTKSVVLSAHDEDEYVLEAMGAGASGYLLKRMDAGKLPEAVRRAHSGETVLYPPVSEQFSRLLGGASLSTKQEPLTSREREILSLASQGARNQEIAEELGLSVRTVEGHFARIFVKLAVSSRLEAVRVAETRGIVN